MVIISEEAAVSEGSLFLSSEFFQDLFSSLTLQRHLALAAFHIKCVARGMWAWNEAKTVVRSWSGGLRLGREWERNWHITKYLSCNLIWKTVVSVLIFFEDLKCLSSLILLWVIFIPVVMGKKSGLLKRVLCLIERLVNQAHDIWMNIW